ncbi:MAG TPA: hypothetical protein VGI78_10805 [Acetobacteraceae bacterium]|jgi:hypothetical protein
MASLHALTRARLIKLLEDTIAEYGDERFTIKQLATRALPKARDICRDDFDSAICGWLKPLARRLLTKEPAHSDAPVLLPGLALPYRIAVPSLHSAETYDPDEDDETESGIMWIPLHMCSIAEARRNLAMRADLIEKSQVEHDRIRQVIDEAASLTEDEDAIIGELLSR